MNMHLTYETGISFVLYYASRVSNKKVKSGASKDLFMLYAGGHVIVIVVEFVLKFNKKFDKVFYFKEKGSRLVYFSFAFFFAALLS